MLRSLGVLFGSMPNRAACLEAIVNPDLAGTKVDLSDSGTREVFFIKLVEELDGYASRFSGAAPIGRWSSAVVQPADIAYQVREAARATDRHFASPLTMAHTAYARFLNGLQRF